MTSFIPSMISDSGMTGERSSRAAHRHTWLALFGVLILSLPPLLIELTTSDPSRTMETMALASAQETWLRVHGSPASDLTADPQAWIIPSIDGRPRVNKPPLVVWLQLLAAYDLRPEIDSPQAFIARARYVSVAMGLLLIAATFWAGESLGGLRLAAASALVAGCIWFLQRQARLASYDIHFVAWVTLAIASGLWATKPRMQARPVVPYALGWAAAGLFLAFAVLSKGPLAYVVTLLPLIGMTLILNGHRRRNLGGVMIATIASLIIAAPWYMHAANQIAEPGAIWAEEWRAERDEFQPPWYYLGLLGLVAPWTVWLVGGLALPFMDHARPRRHQLLLPWIWFVLIFVFFSMPGAKQQRYILPIVPAAALLIGQMWTIQQSFADRGRVDPGIDRLRVPHWVALLATCAMFVPITLRWPQLLGPMQPTTMIITATILLGIAVCGAYWHFRWRPMRAFGAIVAWTLVLTTVAWSAYSRSPERDDPVRAAATQVNQYLDGRALGRLWAPEQTYMLNEQFMIHSQRLVPRVEADELGDPNVPPFVMADDHAHSRAIMSSAGWRVVGRFEPDTELVCALWTDLADAPPLDESES